MFSTSFKTGTMIETLGMALGKRPTSNVQHSTSSETADDGIRTRDLRFTKPLLYQLSYVGARRANIAPSGAGHKRCYSGRTNVSPISRSAMRSGVLLKAISKRSIGSRIGSKLSRKV